MISVGGILRNWKARDFVAVTKALCTQLRIEWSIHRRPLPVAAASLGVPLVTDGSAPVTDPFSSRLTRDERCAVRAAQRVLRHWPRGDTCLRRALATGYALRSRAPSLRVGVAKSGGQVRAHAWLEIDGQTLDPDGAAEYLSLVPLHDQGAA